MPNHDGRWSRRVLATVIFGDGWSRDRKVLWVLVSGSVFVLWIALFGVRLIPPYERLHDFAQDWSSARSFYVQKPIYMDLRRSLTLYLPDGRGNDLPEGVYNAHPPTSVLLALPFGMLDYDRAYLAWNFVSLLALGGSLWLIVRSAGLAYSPWSLLPMLTLLLMSHAFAQQLYHGQLNLILLLMVTGAWAAEDSPPSPT